MGHPAMLQANSDHVARSKADLGTQPLGWQRLNSATCQHEVGCADEVWRRIDKGTVEVENEGEIAHHQSSAVSVETDLGDPSRAVTGFDRACQQFSRDLDQSRRLLVRYCGSNAPTRSIPMDKPVSSLLRTQCYADGRWVGEPALPVIDPATGEEITKRPTMGAEETRAAIDAAERALPEWAGMLAKDRAKILRRWYELQMEHADELALLMTTEQGKPLAEAKGEVAYAASFVEFYAEEAKRIYGETIPTFKKDARIVCIKQPVGVVAAITPWNFPAAMITRKVAPALAVGCTVVCKPASETPLTALALAELAERAGVPKGVFNVVTGKASVIGGELTSNPKVRMLTFTGSTEIGKILIEQCAKTVKKVGMELGGNAPFIVFDDADLDKAVQGAMASKYRNAGQTCVCANRIYV